MNKLKLIITLLCAVVGMNSVFAAIGVELDRSGYKAYASSACNDGGSNTQVECVLDGNISTYWHTRYNDDNAYGVKNGGLPQFLVIDRGFDTAPLTGFGYMPRQHNQLANGTVSAWKLFVTDTNPLTTISGSDKLGVTAVSADWTQVATGNYSITTANNNNGTVFQTEFSSAVTGRYVIFEVTASSGQNSHVNCAEFYLYTSVFNPNAKYTLHAHGTASYATTTDGSGTYAMSTTAESFTISGNETDGWVIQSTTTGKYIGLSGTWNVGNNEQKWDFVAVDGEQDTYYIRRHGDNSKALGWDSSNNIPTFTYTNKGNSDFKWIIRKEQFFNVGTAVTTLTAGNWYMLYNVGRTGYVSEEISAMMMRDTSNVPNGSLASAKSGYMFRLIQTDGGYYIQSGNGKYFSLGRDVSTMSENPVLYEIGLISGQTNKFCMKDVNSGYYADGQPKGQNFVGWSTTAPTGGTGNDVYQFLPVELYSQINYIHNGTVIRTVENSETSENHITIDGVFYIVVSRRLEGDNINVEVKTVSEVLPSGYYTIGCADNDRAKFLYNDYLHTGNDHHYTLQHLQDTRPGNSAIWKISTDNSATIHVTNQDGRGLTNNRNTATEYKTLTVGMYYATNNSYYFTEVLNGSNGGQKLSDNTRHLTYWDDHIEANDNHWIFTQVEATDIEYLLPVVITGDGTADAYVTYGSDIAFNGGFFIGAEAFTSTEGFVVSHVDGCVSTITLTDGTLTVAYRLDPTELRIQLTELIESIEARLGAGLGEYTISAADAQLITESKNLAASVSVTVEELASQVELVNAIALNINTPEAGQFFRIQCADVENGIYATNDVKATADATGANTIFTIVNDKLVGYDNGKCPEQGQNLVNGVVLLAQSTQDYVIREAPSYTGHGVYWITNGNRSWHGAGVSAGSNLNGGADLTDTNTQEGYRWKLIEVTSLPVSISQVGYATLNLPVATTIPVGVEAWYASAYNEQENTLTLTRLEAGATLPQNFAVILRQVSGESPYNFNIVANVAEEDIPDNEFSGTVAAKMVAANSIKVLGLRNGSENLVGLYTFTGTEMSGFKMYYEGDTNQSGSTDAQFVRLSWGDLATAIDAANDETLHNGVMYNINGQRVMKANGLVIVNGQKMIVR